MHYKHFNNNLMASSLIFQSLLHQPSLVQFRVKHPILDARDSLGFSRLSTTCQDAITLAAEAGHGRQQMRMLGDGVEL